jgi:hypothetical protein
MRHSPKRSGPVVVGLLLLAGLFACMDDYFDLKKLVPPRFEPSFALPLLNTELRIDHLFEEPGEFIREDPLTGLISLVFENKGAYSRMAEDIISVPDQKFLFPETIRYFPTPTGTPFTFEYSMFDGFVTEVEHQRFDTLYFKEGTKKVRYTTNINHPSVINIVCSSLINKHNNQPYTSTREFHNPGGGQYVMESQLNLRDYYIVFCQDQVMPNSVTFDFILDIYGVQGGPARSYQFDTEVTFEDIRYQKIVGYFAQYDFSVSDTMYYHLFNNITEGNFRIFSESAHLDLIVHNSAGMPIQIDFDRFVAVSEKDPPEEVDIRLFGPGTSNSFLIGAPTLEQAGQTVSTQPDTQSNLAEALNISPDYIYFEATGISNPALDPSVTNFMLDTSAFSLDLITTLDLHGLLEHFTLQDTLAFDTEFPDEVVSAELMVRAINSFPLEIDLQLFFMDGMYQLLDSLPATENRRIEGARPGPAPERRIVEPRETLLQISLSENQLSNMSRSEYVMLRASLSTTGREYVKIYTDCSLQLHMSAVVNTRITP